MKRTFKFLGATLIASIIIGAPVGYAAYRQANFRNFRVVREDVLYRSGQLSRAGLERVLHDYGIRTVISLRDTDGPGWKPTDTAEENYCRDQDIRFLRLPPRKFWAPDGSVPAEENVRQFLAVLDNPANYPVLVHCFAGIHRTGAMVAVYRMEYEQWSNDEALDELRACGYRNLDDEWDVLTYLEYYRPRWMKNK